MDASPRRRVDWLYGLLGSLIILGLGVLASQVSTGMADLKTTVGDMRVEVAELRTTVNMGMKDRFTGKEGEDLADRIREVEGDHKQLRDKVEHHLSKGALELHRELHKKEPNGGP